MMANNPNNFMIYIRDENKKEWAKLGRTNKSGFVNWCIKRKQIDEYLKYLKEGKQ